MWDNCKYFNDNTTMFHKAALAMEKVSTHPILHCLYVLNLVCSSILNRHFTLTAVPGPQMVDR